MNKMKKLLIILLFFGFSFGQNSPVFNDRDKQEEFSKLIKLSVNSVETKFYEVWDMEYVELYVYMKSVKNKKINSLQFILKVYDKNKKLLGEGNFGVPKTFDDELTYSWVLTPFKTFGPNTKLYGLLNGSSVEDYTFEFEFYSLIYDGELINFE